MAPDECGSLRNCSSSVKSRHVLKKGPWTTSEDMILVKYVKKHGEGNWNAVQRNSGLMRCGKSCRLRWANHLRPNLKKGAFSAEEEKLIVDLHAKLGNKWARMAAQLPGRTDNEIKNYWNTRLKRRQRAGLPIYPQEVSVQKEQHLNSSAPSLLSKSSSQSPGNNLNRFSFTSPQSVTPYMNQNHHHLKLYGASNGLSFASVSSNIPSNAYFNHGPSPLMSSWLFQYDSGLNYGGHHGLGLPSIQSSPATTPSSSDFVIATGTATSSTDGGDQDYHDQVEPAAGFSSQGNKSGLLEDLLGESQALGCHQEHVAGNENEKGFGNLVGHGNSNSDDNSYEGQGNKGQGEGMNCMDEDLLNLLDNFPLSVPIPDWNDHQGRHDTESPILTEDTAAGAAGSQHDASDYSPVATSSAGAANQDWNFGSCLWNNMPSIY